MIDNEALYIDEIASAVLAAYPNADVTSIYVPEPSSFPHVYIRETDNSTNPQSVTLCGREEEARITYTVDVFSNARSGSKSECRAVMAIIDEVMLSRYFRRTLLTSYPNQNDATIYRLVARYTKLENKRRY